MLTLKNTALSILFLALLVACSGGKPGGAAAHSGATSGAAPAADSAAGSGSSQGAPEEAFPCSSRLSGGKASINGQLTDVRVARHSGYDRITFQFDSTSVPQYRLVPQSSAAFVKDPSGLPLNLEGTAGLGIVFPGSSGVGLGVTPSRQTYTGSQDIKASLPFVRELAQVGDFERVLTWGAGLASSPCIRTTEFANPTRLAVDVRSGTPQASADEIQAVAARIFAGEHPMGCSPRDRATCPITDRLAQRFSELSQTRPDQPGPPNLFCRCQNAASRAVNVDAETSGRGGTAHVTLYPDTARPLRVDLLVVRQGAQLLVDDLRCTGKGPSTSIYAPQLVACG